MGDKGTIARSLRLITVLAETYDMTPWPVVEETWSTAGGGYFSTMNRKRVYLTGVNRTDGPGNIDYKVPTSTPADTWLRPQTIIKDDDPVWDDVLAKIRRALERGEVVIISL